MLRTLLFFIVVILVTVVGALAVMLIGLFRRYSQVAYRYVFRPWARSIVWAAGVKVEVAGQEHVNPNRAYLIVSNHQSHMDVPVLGGYLPLKLTIIAKKELFRIPIFSHGMRAFGILEIDRSNRARAIQTLEQAALILREKNTSVLTFPEGTRSADGRLQPFKKGPFALASTHRFPILPVTVRGTFPVLPKGRLRVKPGRVTLIIHPPVEPDHHGAGNQEELIEQVRQTIAAGLYEQKNA